MTKDSAIKYHKHCLRCGRKLKNEEAQIRGYGTICFKKMQRKNRSLF